MASTATRPIWPVGVLINDLSAAESLRKQNDCSKQVFLFVYPNDGEVLLPPIGGGGVAELKLPGGGIPLI